MPASISVVTEYRYGSNCFEVAGVGGWSRVSRPPGTPL